LELQTFINIIGVLFLALLAILGVLKGLNIMGISDRQFLNDLKQMIGIKQKFKRVKKDVRKANSS
jgi:hypothetical protein